MPDSETDTLRQVPEESTELAALSTAERGEQTDKRVSRRGQICLRRMAGCDEKGAGVRLLLYRICNLLILRNSLFQTQVEGVADELMAN